MKKIMIGIVIAAVGLVSHEAYADWHGGRVMQINIGYDGAITFTVDGWARSNCTCSPTWSTVMCLNRARTSFKEEVAMLFSARARDTELFAHIDETTCSVVAMYEVG